MTGAEVLTAIRQELERLTASLERQGYKTRAADQPSILRNGVLATHYSYGSPHPRGYTEQPEWQELRERLFRSRGKRCEHCHRAKIVQVHHRYYFSSCEGWSYEDRDLCLLCRVCHSLVHGYVGDAERLLRRERKLPKWLPHQDEDLDDDEDTLYEEYGFSLEVANGEVDPTVFFDEDNPELWRIEYVEDPEGRSDRLRLDLDEDSDDERDVEEPEAM